MMTALPSDVIRLEPRNGHHLLHDPEFISSSKGDVVVREELTQWKGDWKKQNRFFFHPFVPTTTVYSFVLNTFFVPKKFFLAYSRRLICRPSEFPVCMV